MNFERKIEINPPFDKRHIDPNKSYGVHGLEFRYILIGPKGAVQWLCFTGLYTQNVLNERINNDYKHKLKAFMPADLGYHSYESMYEGQEQNDCCYLGTGKCYYDGSGLQAERVLPIFLNEGSEGVWKFLENRYNELFN